MILSKKNDKMINMIELNFFLRNHYFLRVYIDIFLQIVSSFEIKKRKMEILEEVKNLKTETGAPFATEL